MQQRLIRAGLTALIVALGATTASAAEVKITKHAFEYNTIKYFRGKAENIQLGSYGEKKDPIGPDAYLSVQNKIKNEYLTGHIKSTEPIDVNWSQQTKVEVEGNPLAYFGLGSKGAIGFDYEKAKTANLKLVKFFVDEGTLRTILNTEASGAKKYLADEGADGRVVGEIWVVMEGKLAEHFSTSAGLTFTVAGTGIDVTAKGGVAGTQTITLSAGATFAYLLFKVKEWNKDKTKILNLEDDKKGAG